MATTTSDRMLPESTYVKSACHERTNSFDNTNLRDEILRGIYADGFKNPSDIQQRVIVPCITGRDVIIRTQSGTGKTVAFVIAVLQRTDVIVKECQALILTSTRKVASRITTTTLTLGDYLSTECRTCVGGFEVQKDIDKLSDGIHIIVGTPGRVFDLVQRRVLRTEFVNVFVLDDADEMLSRGSGEQIYQIMKILPGDRQVVLLSTTMPPQLLDITKKIMREPVRILNTKDELIPENIKQFYIDIQKNE